ncbi:MAG: hypothetical protein CMG07_04575 [Candidatus Marinimicrobia bacterium]|nr:hypothetical protein [Candidatus Neomarinimicrobiota bacterium]
MNNVLLIKKFIADETKSCLLINQVSEEIGFFYINFVKNESDIKNIKLNYKSNYTEEEVIDLFKAHEIDLYFSNNRKDINTLINSNNKCIIFTDYKNFKIFSSSILTVNGYEYQKDINYYIKEELKIDNSELVDFSKENPYLAFSEISKYLVNSKGYVKENKIKESHNFILEIRKELFNLKRNQKSSIYIYSNLKQEVKYKKFNFLIY